METYLSLHIEMRVVLLMREERDEAGVGRWLLLKLLLTWQLMKPCMRHS